MPISTYWELNVEIRLFRANFKTAKMSKQCLDRRLFSLPRARACPLGLVVVASDRAMSHLPLLPKRLLCAVFLTSCWSGYRTSRSAAPRAPGRQEGAACLRAHSCSAWLIVCGHMGLSTFCLGSCSADIVPQVHPQLDFQVRLDVRTASSIWGLGRGLRSPGTALRLTID